MKKCKTCRLQAPAKLIYSLNHSIKCMQGEKEPEGFTDNHSENDKIILTKIDDLTKNSCLSTQKFNLLFPKSQYPQWAKRLLRIYDSLKSIYRYNKNRRLKTIFHEIISDIHSITRQYITILDMQHMYALAPELDFHEIQLSSMGKKVETFTISNLDKFDLASRLKDYFLKESNEFLNKNGESNLHYKCLKSFDLSSLTPPQPLVFLSEKTAAQTFGLKTKHFYPAKQSSVLERIKAKEAARRDEYKKHFASCRKEEQISLINRISAYFLIESKSRLTLDSLKDVLGIVDKSFLEETVKNSETFKLITINLTTYITYR